MTTGGVWANRMRKELDILRSKGVPSWTVDGAAAHIRVTIAGPPGSPYEGGTFLLDVQTFERYPFDPPKVRFITRCYHPNVDDGGRICLSVLTHGTWKPSMNIYSVLQTIQQLMGEPNGEDALVAEIGEEFLKNKPLFLEKARKCTKEHAMKPVAPPQETADGKRSRDGDTNDKSPKETTPADTVTAKRTKQ